ncbi:hypothetical protein Adt_11671 [Abeliophyllum distichum]|uniref:Uncharacterized protein n=1 Tax=Abeliophyllum distichum TaxID=126358 RepID=A0ABD1UNI0_9LAMI
MNLIWKLVLTMEVYSTLEDFDCKFSKEEAKSKKLSKDLKVMSLEKAQLESDKMFLQIRLDSVVAKEIDLKVFATETTVAIGNNNFEAMVVEKDKQLAEVKKEVERVKADCDGAEARVVMTS